MSRHVDVAESVRSNAIPAIHLASQIGDRRVRSSGTVVALASNDPAAYTHLHY